MNKYIDKLLMCSFALKCKTVSDSGQHDSLAAFKF